MHGRDCGTERHKHTTHTIDLKGLEQKCSSLFVLKF